MGRRASWAWRPTRWLGARPRSCRPARAAGARTSPGSSSGCPVAYAPPRRAPGRHRAGRHPRRARSTWTRRPSPLGARSSRARPWRRSPPSPRRLDGPAVRGRARRSSLRLRPAAEAASPRCRSSPATRPGCWSTAARRAARAPHGGRPARAARPRRPARGQRHPGPPRPPPAAQAHRRSGRGAAARAPSRGHAGRRWSGPAAGSPPGTVAQPARRRCAVEVGRGPGRRRGAGRGPGRRRRPWRSTPSARCRSRPTSTTPLADPERYQTVYARRPGSVAAPTAGLHLTDARARRLPGRGRRWWRRRARVGLGTFRPITADRVEDHPMHAERYRVPAGRARGLRAPGPPSRVVAVGTTVVRALESGRHRASRRGRHRPVHPRRLRVRGGRPAADQLPRAPVVAARAGRRLRRARAGDGSTTTALAEGYRFLSFGDAMLLDRRSGPGRVKLDRRRRGQRRRRSHRRGRHAAGHASHAVLHAGRHPRLRCGRCRRRPRGPRRRGGARQHVPPDAAPGRRRRRRRSAGCTASWPGTATCSPTRGGYQVFSLEPEGRRRRGRRSAPPTTAARHHLSPEGAVAHPGAARRRHPDGARRVPAAARARPRWCAPPSSAPPHWAERARAAFLAGAGGASRPGADQAQFGIVQGGVDAGLRAESARRTVDARLRRLRHRRAVGGGDPGRDAAGPRRRPSPSCPPTSPAT